MVNMPTFATKYDLQNKYEYRKEEINGVRCLNNNRNGVDCVKFVVSYFPSMRNKSERGIGLKEKK